MNRKLSIFRTNGLAVAIDGTNILDGLDLTINAGEVHAIMGPNGSGKSTFAKVIAGHPGYAIAQGEILYRIDDKWVSLKDMAAENRAREGIFLAFQYPAEIPGVINGSFLRGAYNALVTHKGGKPLGVLEFKKFIIEKTAMLDLDPSFLDRQVNVDFSGGEKKRNEILQMAVLSPRLAILDETDSGLDIDSLKIVADGINTLRSKDNALVVITHYQRLLEYVRPDFVHVMIGGRIVRSGDASLAEEIEEKGYDWLQ